MNADDIHFRPGTAADALCLGVLALQVFLDTYATEGIRPTVAREVLEQFSTEAMRAKLAQPDTHFIVAERAGHLLAFAHLTLGTVHEHVPQRPSAELDRLYVQERFTGRGVGKALLTRAEAFARREGVAAMWLTTWVGNTRALAFYPLRGYRDCGATLYEFQNEQHENRVFVKALIEAGSGRS